MPKDIRLIFRERDLYIANFIKGLSSLQNTSKDKLLRDTSVLSLYHISPGEPSYKPLNKLADRLINPLTNSGRFDWKINSLLDSMATAALPRDPNRYKEMNGSFGRILPPDDSTMEMAVDCPPEYVAKHPPRSGRSTPSVAGAPPSTPLDKNINKSQKAKTAKDLEDAAKVAATLPQPDMNFDRINRMRESARRQKEQKIRDALIRQQMTGKEGAKKIQSLKHMTPDEQLKAKKKGVENLGFQRDSYIENGDARGTAKSPAMDIQEMFTSLNAISSEIDDEDLNKDLGFIKELMQSENFQEAVKLHTTIVESTTPQSNAPLQPQVTDMQSVADNVQEELLYRNLPQGTELNNILSSPAFKGLISAHDGAAILLEPRSSSNPYNEINIHNAEDEEIIQRVSQYTDKNVRVVRIDKTTEALGATVRTEDDGTVAISRIISGGIAERSNLLHEGDELIEVNGRAMRGLDVNEVGDTIAGMNGTLVFVLASPNKVVNGRIVKDPNEVVKHVRALFDYDAFDDPYLPCRELGLSFQKGDVLRIMSTDDANWWQAYRDDEDDTHLTLAGLVPSQDFQHQREALRISLIKENNAPEKKKSLLCGMKKKPKQAPTLYNENDDDEDIQTYEELALYHQPEARKRPIVLIGPPNVGRHELRQRLVDNDRERFASPVPHTTRPPNAGEREGIDYHFVSQNEFESMVARNAFVEYGAYQKILYGTAIEAVRSIIDISKICVLNLHAESLRTLCTSDLKPYIVFIGPPPLEKLRQNMRKEGKQLKEAELRSIIEKARDIEQRYGHYFDETIRNTDLNRSYAELLRSINKLDTEPQWVPASWLDDGSPL
ncbi:protein PALS1-like isoform X2 [Clavelina lepadiformis]|uniref:MAGUK p55 subfamily member 5 n=1 Tax=Clavelina lepadiformis TaxID=159417 RepID=A0ABP0GNZ4_CLALP